MIFFKSLIFLVYNILAGVMIPVLLRTSLLFPPKQVCIAGKKIPFTPGFLYRKRDLLINKLKDMLRNYLRDCNDSSPRSSVSVMENRIFRNTWDNLVSIERIRFLPRSLKNTIRYSIALLVYEIAKQFFRTFIPFLLEKYKAKKLISIIENKIDMKIIVEYFDKYVFRFMVIFFISINLFIGLGNMIVYLIIH